MLINEICYIRDNMQKTLSDTKIIKLLDSVTNKKGERHCQVKQYNTRIKDKLVSNILSGYNTGG